MRFGVGVWSLGFGVLGFGLKVLGFGLASVVSVWNVGCGCTWRSGNPNVRPSPLRALLLTSPLTPLIADLVLGFGFRFSGLGLRVYVFRSMLEGLRLRIEV